MAKACIAHAQEHPGSNYEKMKHPGASDILEILEQVMEGVAHG